MISAGPGKSEKNLVMGYGNKQQPIPLAFEEVTSTGPFFFKPKEMLDSMQQLCYGLDCKV